MITEKLNAAIASYSLILDDFNVDARRDER